VVRLCSPRSNGRITRSRSPAGTPRSLVESDRSDIEQLMRQGSKTATPAITAHYNAPFPDPSYEAGARRFPIIVPISPTEDGAAISREAVAWWGSQWNGKSFMAVGVQDELLGPPIMNVMQKLIRNCPLPVEYPNAGHFIQEDAGTEVAEAALRAFG
jgi:haloalkane dehalogenase